MPPVSVPPRSDRGRVWRPGSPCDPHDILRVLRRGAGDPAYQRDADGSVWRASRTPDGPVTLRILATPRLGTVDLRAWGPGADWALVQAPELLGGNDDLAGFRPSRAMVAAAWATNPHWRIARTRRVLESLVAAALEQKVTGREAWLGWRRLLLRYGTVAPGPGADRGMRCLPAASDLAMVPSWGFRQCHVDHARSQTVVRAARVAEALERTVELDPDDADRRLQSIPGVGQWTSAEVRQRAHGDSDAVSFGDYHVADHVGFALLGARHSTDHALAELLEEDRPHRYRIQHVVTTRLPGPPRRGPRMSPRRHLPA